MKVGVKPYPSCHFTHAVIDATLILTQEHQLTVDQIDSITALVPEEVIKTVCEPIENKQSPTCAYEAQFSVPYLIAVALARHDFSLADLEPEPLADPVVANLAKKVNYEIDPDSGFPTYYSGEVHIKLTDGRLLKHREHKNRGCFDRPLSAEDITNKFNLNCQLAVSEEASDNIKKAILGLTSFSSVTELTRHL